MGLLRGAGPLRRRMVARRLKARFARGEVLLPCAGFWGGLEIREQDPALEVHHDAIYVPRNSGILVARDEAWGLYRADGRLIEASSYRRGPEPVRIGMGDRTALRVEQIARAPDALYLYVGLLHRHFGHFLIAALARFWPRLKARADNVRLVYHGDDEPEAVFKSPFVAAILTTLGIGAEDLVRFSEPTALPELLLPGPSFEESLLGHRVHAELGAEIGRGLIGAEPPEREARPVYLSRARLAEGVRRFVDEDAIATALDNRGVRVVSPETLSLADQVRLFEAHPLVMGVVGSQLHTSLLSPRPNRILALQHHALVPSDYALIDRLKGNRADYLWAKGEASTVEVARTGFQVEFRLTNVGATIDGLLRFMEQRVAEL